MPRFRGFTLVEMVVSLALTLIVTAAVHQLITATQHWSRVQLARLTLQSTVRTGVVVAASELRGLNTAVGGAAEQIDLQSLGPNAVVYRAARGMGFLCQPPVGTQLRFARSGFSGLRDPQAGRDLVYLYRPGTAPSGADDAWMPLAISAVAPNSTCSGGPAVSLTTSVSGWPSGVTTGTPVRIVELMELKSYQSEGQWWLGLRSVSAGEAIQPVAGPLDGASGFHLAYLSGNGGPTADPGAVAGIQIVVRGISTELRQAGIEPSTEEIATQVTLRNGSRP